MNFKHFAAYLIVIVLVLGMTGCSEAVSYADDLEDEAPLNIYLIMRTIADVYVDNAVDQYNQSRLDGERNIVVTKFEDMDTMYTRILREMSAGGGPDILCVNKLTDDYIDIHKIAKQGSFADMDILIENSKTFDFSAYNEGALETGIIDDKRIMMPLGYTVPYLVGVEESFIYNQLDIPDKMTLDTYLDLMDTYYHHTENKPACWGIDPVYVLAEYIETGETIEKTPEIQHLFELLKTEYRYMPNVRKIDHIYTLEDWFNTYNLFIGNHYLFYKSIPAQQSGFTQLEQFHEQFNMIENANNSKMLWYSQPLKEKDTPKAYVENLLAINVNSKHKNEAFEFVEFALSKQMQSTPSLKHDFDVNVKSYQEDLKSFKSGYVEFSGWDGMIETHVPNDMVNDFIAHLDSIQTYEYIGEFRYLYHNVFYESIQSYYDDHITFDEMIDEMNNKMAIYLSE